MPVNQQELGRRLRLAREACRMTQEAVARRLGVSRSTVAQMELGNRAVTSLELDRLATLYGRDIREFLAEEFREDDALVALFRAHPDDLEQEQVADAIRGCMALGREVTNLERLLGIDRDLGAVAVYPVPAPRGRWPAVQQGEQVADQERLRLGLGVAPIANVAEMLETQGVRTALVDLPEDVSGLTLSRPTVGLFIVANRRHHFLRRRFSYAHEYAHVLLDRDRLGTISRARDRDDLIEVRANAFAASLLLPEEGVRRFMTTIGKGGPSRLQADVFDESGVVEVRARAAPESRDVQLYEVAELADHFGVSRLAALYRLRNLRLITDAELETLRRQEDAGQGRQVAALLDLPEVDHEAARNEFRHRLLGLALEALRRGEISRAKLVELAGMVDLGPEEVARLLHETGLEDPDGEGEILLPAD
ncbi:MAG TPA: XRE family transcriptional regulator [Candidatus Binatia bacterium]|nr:XRE family transcriptional regulator [Candidatus Binatia bacterium]